MNLTLYAAPMSSATPVVNVLTELDVPHETVLFDLAKNEQKQPAYLALNPNGRVPTLVVDGTPLFEALAIMQWLGDRFGVERGLWPAADSPERLEALSWTTWAYVTYGARLHLFITAQSERIPSELHSPQQAKLVGEELQGLLGLLDARLAKRDYIVGEGFSLADLVVGCVITYGSFSGAKVKAHRHVSAWLDRVFARRSFETTWGKLTVADL